MGHQLPKFSLYCDENFPAQAGRFLRSLGNNVKQTKAILSAKGLSDFAQLRIAIKDKRIFITLDRDFHHMEVLIEKIRKTNGVILVETSDLYWQSVIKTLRKQFKNISTVKIKGKICKISMDKINYQ